MKARLALQSLIALVALAASGIILMPALLAANDAPIDLARVRQIMMKRQQGEALTPDESACLNRALEMRR